MKGKFKKTAKLHIYWVLHLSGIESNTKKASMNCPMTHFFSFVAFRSKFYCRRINSFIRHNTTIINIFNSDNSNIAYIKTQHCHIMTIITYIILKFESMIKKPIVTNDSLLSLLLVG